MSQRTESGRTVRKSRSQAQLRPSLEKNLLAYAAAATAAGVGILACPPAAVGKIVYTPAHVKLVGKPFPLDLNHDGVVDFFLFAYGFHTSTGGAALLACHNPFNNGTRTVCVSSTLGTNASNAIRVARSMNYSFAAALHSGAKIRAGDKFRSKHDVYLGLVNFTSGGQPRWGGPWMNGGKGVKDRYLGIKFKIKDQFHLGWARITVATRTNAFTGTLTGYAYETIPGKAIVAGQTKGPDELAGSLGALAAGAAAIPSWRK